MKWRLVLVLLISVLCGSCREEPPAPLSKDERKIVDSIYSRRASIIRKEVDSICTMQKQSMFQEMVDSIKAEYIKDIEKIIQE